MKALRLAHARTALTDGRGLGLMLKLFEAVEEEEPVLRVVAE
jgi:hypothetical protein